MSSNKHYTDEFRAEEVRQVIERGFTVVDMATRIEIPKHTLYGWARAAKKSARASDATVAPSDSAFPCVPLMLHLQVVSSWMMLHRPVERAAAYFAKGKGEVRIHACARSRVSPDDDVPGAGRATQRASQRCISEEQLHGRRAGG